MAAVDCTMADLFYDSGRSPRHNGKPVPSVREEPTPIHPDEVRRMHEAMTREQRDYLIERRCLSDEVIDRYKLGFWWPVSLMRSLP